MCRDCMLTRPARLVGVVLAFLPISSSCQLFEPSGCDAYAATMLDLRITDAGNGQPLAIPLRVAVYSVEHGDSIVLNLDAPVPRSFGIPEGINGGWGPGRYDLKVRGDGFQVWRREGIPVQQGACGHPKTVTVQVALKSQ